MEPDPFHHGCHNESWILGPFGQGSVGCAAQQSRPEEFWRWNGRWAIYHYRCCDANSGDFWSSNMLQPLHFFRVWHFSVQFCKVWPVDLVKMTLWSAMYVMCLLLAFQNIYLSDLTFRVHGWTLQHLQLRTCNVNGERMGYGTFNGSKTTLAKNGSS